MSNPVPIPKKALAALIFVVADVRPACQRAYRSQPLNLRGKFRGWQKVLGGSWDLVITCNWAYHPTYRLPKWPYIGNPIRSRVTSPVISSY